ncbi:hypothetical protein [Jiangella asiatica]|uniref:Uncharacterized protein n=1 Tax=Jiangella asiatica TaxID=2530372 RepID=A0A4R5DAL2_9ACTN|nr:hypothetical protein [Jiangella asiatica]TDE10676.1 hypothetical protein E1269_11425 [Jiangella asiatica]
MLKRVGGAQNGPSTELEMGMSTSHPSASMERPQASLIGLYVAVAGVVIFNIAVFLTWASQDDDSFSGYESDSLVPFVAYLGLGLAAALLFAASRADRRQHRGLSLASMAVGIAATLQCLAWLLDVPGAAERSAELDSDIGVWIGLLGALLWTIGSAVFAKEPEGDLDRAATPTKPATGYTDDPGRGTIAGA